MITYEQALTVNEFHDNHAKNADGTCHVTTFWSQEARRDDA